MTNSAADASATPAPIRIASALFEIEVGEPTSSARILLRALSALFVVLLLRAAFARLDIVAVAQGGSSRASN